VALAVGGCGGKVAKKTTTSAAGGERAAPAVDPDTAFTIDDGRVSVASPAGWTRAERSKDWLVKYQPGRKKTYPAIVVTGEDAPADFPAITAENHAAFAAALALGMADAYDQIGASALAKKPVAVKLGPHHGAAWALPAQAKVSGLKETIEQQFYAVIVGGRMYRIAVKAPKGKLDADAKAAARAVAGAIGPPAAAEPEEPEGESDEKPAAAAAPDAKEGAASGSDAATPGSEAKPDATPDAEKPAAE
jgi:hypothetical protein